jgi:hypothetical protein
MIKDSEFDRNNIATTTINPLSNLFDLLAEVERPFRVGSLGIEDGCDVISKYT